MKCDHKEDLSLAQNLTFESGFPSSEKPASYGSLVRVFIFLKLLRAVNQRLCLMPPPLIFLGLTNGAGLVGSVTRVSAVGALTKTITNSNARLFRPLCGAALEMNMSQGTVITFGLSDLGCLSAMLRVWFL